jgi:XTP/dITP diphosphohydrolase
MSVLWYKKAHRNPKGAIMEIVLATRNKKKVEEIKRITEGMEVTIFTLDDFPGCPEVEEDGATFEENAVKKAVTVARFAGKPALADDSGLEVYALGGSPGTRSARYSGCDADDGKNTEKLLSEMRLLPKEDRKARFVCSMALAMPDGNVRTFNGCSEGGIGTEPRGFNGFGYDPVFFPQGFDRTFGEMSAEEKDSLSHRGNAIRQLQRYLSDNPDCRTM